MLTVVRTSPFSGNVNSREVDITPEMYDRWLAGELIQNVMPHISADDREFIMTGITPEEWDNAFG